MKTPLNKEAIQMNEIDNILLEIENEGFEQVEYQDFKTSLDKIIENAE